MSDEDLNALITYLTTYLRFKISVSLALGLGNMVELCCPHHSPVIESDLLYDVPLTSVVLY